MSRSLNNGSLVRVVREDFPLEPKITLTTSLSRADFAGFNGPTPRIPPPKSLMLLHSSGRYLFSGPRTVNTTPTQVVADFVGVNLADVRFHSPGEEDLTQLFYRGTNVRGTIAIAPRPQEISRQYVVFLDLRLVAAAPQFVCLTQPFISYQHLLQLVPRLVPAGWRVAVRGGHRRGDYLEVEHRETITIGLVHETTPATDQGSSTSSEAPLFWRRGWR